MEEDGEDWTPFWVQNTTDLGRTDRLRHRVSSIFFSSGLLLTLLLLTALFFMVFVIPSTISLTTQIFKPNNVKKSWDSINIVLVLFALVFGFLSRNMNQDSSNSTRFDEFQSRNQIQRSLSSSSMVTTPRWWRKSNPSTPQSGGLRRTFSSYPDLRGWSTESAAYNDDPWRFYDDTRVDGYRRSDSGGSGGGGQLYSRRSWKEVEETEQLEIKNVVQVETVANLGKDVGYDPPSPYSSPPPPPSPPSPLPPPAEPKLIYKSVARTRERRTKRKDNEVDDYKPIESPVAPPPPAPLQASPPSALPPAEVKQIYKSVARKRERRSKIKDNEVEDNKPIESPRTPPPPPPPPPSPPEQSKRRSDKKRSGGSATKEFLNSFYHKKKKKQRQKSIENIDSLIHQPQPPPLHFQLPPPSPLPPPPAPPPPPPPSVFQNLFTSKKDKRKRTQTITIKGPMPTAAPAPAPQPNTAPRAPKPTSQVAATRKPSKPMKIRSFESVDENTNSGGESPFRSIPPPPPPPPPFYKPAWKFVVQGDYVRVDSISSSQHSESPDPSDVESEVTPTAAAAGIGGATLFPPSPLFCPSPDVNTKAERFISRFRAGLKLEKVDSVKKQELGLSNLGPN